MRIGLVDIDGNHAKQKWGAKPFPNIALGKLARWHKEHGDDVEWAFPFDTYDRIYISKIFSFTPDDLTFWQAKEVVRGGTGFDIHSLLPREVDMLQPDYSIFPYIDNRTAYGFLTRGCPNHCKWCVVPAKEGAITPYMDVDSIAIENRHRLVLLDNNILAAGDYAKLQLEKIIHRGYRVDFNQALDARLVDSDFAKLLSQVKWLDNNRIRFGCDTKQQVSECDRAMDLITSFGFSGQFFLYTMLHGDLHECLSRINHFRTEMLSARSKKGGHYVYCHAQPYRDFNNPNQIIPQWQKDMAGWCNKKAHYVSHSFEEFRPRKGFVCSSYL